MCLIAFSWKSHPRYRLALIANRDEYHARATQPASASDEARVFGGRDLEKGGSWLLASTSGRVSAVTNVRAGRLPETAARSRGALTDQFVKSSESIADYLDRLSSQAAEYGRFNLLLGSAGELHYASNHPQFRHSFVSPGVHALSNGDLDAPWPKAERARRALADWLESDGSHSELPQLSSLFDALADTIPAADVDLPDTGVGVELERYLSPPFIVGKDYGTRASSILLIGERQGLLCERRFGADGIGLGETLLRFPT